MDEDEEVIQEFLVEGNEGLDQLDQELLALEDDPSNPERLASIFRTIHSLKGTSGFLGFSKLESISHVGENLLSNMRDGLIELDQPITDALLNLVDASREILSNIDATGGEGDGNYDALVVTLAELAEKTNRPDQLAQMTAVSMVPGPEAVKVDFKPASPLENAEPPASEALHATSPLSSSREDESEALEDEEDSAALSAAPDDASEEDSTVLGESPSEEEGEDEDAPPEEALAEQSLETAAFQEGDHDDSPPAENDEPAANAFAGEEELTSATAKGPEVEEENDEASSVSPRPSPEIAASPPAPAITPPAPDLKPEPAPKPIKPIAAAAPAPKPAPAPNIDEDEDEDEESISEPTAAKPSHRASVKRDSKGTGDMTIRVDVSLLDRLMNLVGELVLCRNQILQVSSKSEDSGFLATTQRLNHITTELQEGLMKTRMQPIKSVWAKFPRVVRDLAKTCEKDVRIEMEGEDTELDRTIIEAIKDPMTHIVRNSVDHGVEYPNDRQARGKQRQGRLSLRAYHEGGKVNIEIADDGKGLDVKRIREKAVEKGVISASTLARMTEREAMQLIFAPGFSTAAAVTQVSGRGVGMDVVKTNIERIGGSIDLSSRINLGTTIKIKIPLTLAIIPALVVNCGGDSYAIPQVSLLELVRFEKAHSEQSIEHVHGAPVCRLRGNLLPLVYLHTVLGVDPVPPEDEAVNIVVLQADDRQFGLVVDHVSDTEEIVVKPLGKELKNVEVFAGATIMGDGRVALILDVLGVAKAGRLASQERDRRLRHVGAADRDGSKKYTMLLFRINENERGAVPLRSIARLEEVPQERIERSGGDEVIQYRGEIMPLIRISAALGRARMPDREVEQVLVYQRRKRSVGVIVDAIEDVVEEQLDVHRAVNRRGVKGQAVLQGRVTELVDLSALIEGVFPGFFEANAAE